MKILIVDDNAINLRLLTALAATAPGASVEPYEDPLAALARVLQAMPDLILVDYMMPGMNGHEFIRRVRAAPGGAEVPIVMVTAADQYEVRRDALEAGATDFLMKPIDPTEMKLRTRNLLQLRRAQNLLADRAAMLADEVEQATQQVFEREQELIARLSRAAEFRDPETGGHIQRMALYSALIARRLGEPEQFQRDLLTVAPMHDIGKLATPDRILLKPGRLDQEELDVMREHAGIGARILSGSSSPLVRMACEIAGSHHEKYDGTGYPSGLAGDEIPLVGRIVAVADVFDALTSPRPYKEAWTLERARDYLAQHSGTHFDPRCVDALLDAWGEVLSIRAAFPD